MGNKSFDKITYKTLLTEATSRMTIRRGKKVNELYRVRDKIVDFVKNGDMSSALIYIDNYINEENKLKVYDALCTMCDQMKGRVTEVESFGITDDLMPNANAIVYAGHRLDIKELVKLSDIMKELMPKVEFKEAMNGTWHNELVRDNTSYRKWEKGESYLKLIELCQETDTQCILKEEWKKVLREYWYKNKVDYPYSAEEDLSYNPHGEVPAPTYAPAAPGGYAPAPAPGGYAPAPGGYGPAPGGYAPAPMYYSAGPGGHGIPPPTTGFPAPPPAGIPAPSPAPMGGSSGYTLPPAADELNLPSYGYDIKKDPSPPAIEKKIPNGEKDDDDSDDEDLMSRLRNLQK